MRSRLTTFLFFAILLIAIGEWDLRKRKLQPLRSLNHFWLEFCVGNAGSKIQNPAVTFVRIEDEYEPLNIGDEAAPAPADGTPPKLSRLDFATILGFVAKQNPKAVSFAPSPVFDESQLLNQTDIVPLKDAALQLPRMTLGTVVTAQKEGENKLPLQSISSQGDLSAVPEITHTVRAPDPQLLANGDPAFTWIDSFIPDVEEGYKAVRLPLIARFNDQVYPSFVLRSVATHLAVPLDKITVDLTGEDSSIQIGEKLKIPIRSDGTMELPDHGGLSNSMTSQERDENGEIVTRHHFTTIKVDSLAYTGNKDDALAKRILSELQGKFDSFADNLVIVGFDRDIDRRILTMNGELLSESSLLARAIATIQSGRHITWWPGWGRWLAVLLVIATAILLFQNKRMHVAILGSLAMIALVGVCIVIFRNTLSWTPPFVMLSLMALATVIGLLIPAQKKDAPNGDAEEAEVG